VPERDDSDVGGWLRRCGHRQSGSPRAMTLDLVETGFDVSDRLSWEQTTDLVSVASLNEQA
jgi:hypothetical protein